MELTDDQINSNEVVLNESASSLTYGFTGPGTEGTWGRRG